MMSPSEPSMERAARILCDGPTYQAARRAFEFAVLPPIVVKGKVDKVDVYRPLARGHRDEPALQWKEALGRDAEARELDALLHRVHEGQSAGTVVISGEAGMGKSDLVAQALSRARSEHGLIALEGAASDVEKATPYFVWRSVFASLIGLDADER